MTLLNKILIGLGMGGAILAGGLTYGALTENEVSLEKLTAKYEASTEIKAKYQLDGASLIKTDIKNAELDKYKNEPKDEIKITLGDKDKTEFVPNIELQRWAEVGFKIKTDNLLSAVATKDKNLSFEGEKVKFDTPKMSFEMYDVPATANDEGSYKFIWYLNSKPLTNKIEFAIETSGLDFFYQPELTPKEIAEGAFRPENVVGSYTVYHSTKGGMNDTNGKEYKVGKAFHIYRPKIIDAEGKETWGILKIENGIYSEEIPQEFLDKAVYPIKSNANFGYTSIGGSSQSDNSVKGSTFSTTEAGTVTSISLYGRSIGDNTAWGMVAIYNGGVGNIGSFVASESSKYNVLSTNSWMTASVSASISGASNYFLLENQINNADNLRLFYDAGSTNQGVTEESIWNTWPNPISTPTYDTNKYSIYATYTPAGDEGGGVSGGTILWEE